MRIFMLPARLHGIAVTISLSHYNSVSDRSEAESHFALYVAVSMPEVRQLGS